jgi:hypothetical protein
MRRVIALQYCLSSIVPLLGDFEIFEIFESFIMTCDVASRVELISPLLRFLRLTLVDGSNTNSIISCEACRHIVSTP